LVNGNARIQRCIVFFCHGSNLNASKKTRLTP
jgi:hypothetical protein